VADFIRAGADIVTVHAEVSPHLHRTLGLIRELGAKAGVVLNPHTPAESVGQVLDLLDVVLVMSVNPGFGGQSFLSSVLPKIEALKAMIADAGSDAVLEIDGGISPGTADAAARAGATVLVAGSAVFGANKKGREATLDERVAFYRGAIAAIREAAGRLDVV
jgi:ribulose-phosphate 3-epimerase